METNQIIPNGAIIVDVRSAVEFAGGNVENSINIPLHEVPHRVEEFRAMQRPIVLCCVSGNRSGQAADYLQAQGIACSNGGSWMQVKYAMTEKIA